MLVGKILPSRRDTRDVAGAMSQKAVGAEPKKTDLGIRQSQLHLPRRSLEHLLLLVQHPSPAPGNFP